MLVGGCAHRESQYTPSGKHFTTDVMNRMTPVKDQGESETCWIYAMLATIETEHLSWGDSVNLSPYYIEKMIEQEANCPKTKRGEPTTLINMIEKYGICGYDAMRKPETPAPKWVFMLGAQYTPQEFARSVCKPGEYIALMSDDSKPYYETSELEVPDNWTIVGLAHDEDGEQYFIMKNSWGDSGPYGGLEYVSYQMFCSETIAVEMTKEAYSN